MPSGPERALIRERLRRRRDALLLELGALVFDLHRQGRRAPDLLKQKAADLDAVEAELGGHAPEVDTATATKTRERGDGGAPCPACGEATQQPDQLVCLNCGARLELGRKPASLLPTLAALLAVVVLGAGAFGFALSELTSDSDENDQQQRAADADPAPTEAQEPTPPETTPQAEGAPQQPRRSLLLQWPNGLTAHTVVLVTTSDKPAARRVARGAARSGIEAGMLRSDDYDLGTGLWIVFAGRFDSRRGATRQAADLAGRYPGAYPQLLRPVG